jgi:hypothetical protein
MSKLNIKFADSDYIPLNPSTIKTGQYFGIYKYSITEKSHEHHKEYLKKGNGDNLFNFKKEFLFPFEIFPFPRVLSMLGGYKKVNEIISIYGERKIYRLPQLDEILCGEVFIDKIFVRNGIVFGYYTSVTKTSKGETLMISIDKSILFNETDKVKFRSMINKDKENILKPPINENVKLVNTTELFFRHTWDDSIWKNNIHTDSYARSLGFEKGLIEAPCFVDILLTNRHTAELLENKLSVKWNYTRPLYHGIKVKIYLSDLSDHKTIYLCNLQNHIMMTLKIYQNE